MMYKEGDSLFADYTFSDGSGLTYRITKERSHLGTKLNRVRTDTHRKAGDGAFWVINSAGNLEMRDEHGVITTANKVY